MQSWPDALVREIAERRALIFIGSGFSKAAKPDMPTWPALVQKLAADLPKASDKKLIKALLAKDALLDAAQIITDAMPSADFSAKMTENFEIRPYIYNEIYSNLLSLDLKTIITTNYDEFIEKNFEYYSGGNQAYKTCTHTARNLLDNLRSPSRIIIKIHGCISNSSELVFDRYSYFESKMKNPSFYEILKSLLTINTILFIGYSISDPDLHLLLEGIHSTIHSKNGHYALMEKFPHPSRGTILKKTYNIHVVEYPKGEHEKVPIMIKSLSDRVKLEREERGII